MPFPFFKLAIKIQIDFANFGFSVFPPYELIRMKNFTFFRVLVGPYINGVCWLMEESVEGTDLDRPFRD